MKVVVTFRGRCYHKPHEVFDGAHCGHPIQSSDSTIITKEEAKERGYRACKSCFKDEEEGDE